MAAERFQRAIVVREMRFVIDVEAMRVDPATVVEAARWCDGSYSAHPLSSGETLVAVAPAGSSESAGAGDYLVRFVRNDIDPEVEGCFAVFTASHLAHFTRRPAR